MLGGTSYFRCFRSMEVTWWDKIVGTWAIAAGISLVFTFVRLYRAHPRYLYLPAFGLWGVLWGVNHLRPALFAPGWLLLLLFALGMVVMLMDSLRRYRETTARLRRERLERLQRGE